MSSILHGQGYRAPSPELERELRTLLGKAPGGLWRADDETLVAIREADPRGWVKFFERHRSEILRSQTAYQHHMRDEAAAKRRPARKLPSLQETEAAAEVEARVKAREKAAKEEADLAALKRAEARGRGEP